MAGIHKLKGQGNPLPDGSISASTYPPATITFNGNAVKQVKHSDGTILGGKYDCHSAAGEIDEVIRSAGDTWNVHTGDDLTGVEAIVFAPAEGVSAKRTLEEDVEVDDPAASATYPVYHGEEVTLDLQLAPGGNYGINEIDQSTAYWITEKSMTKTAEGDIHGNLPAGWIPERDYFKKLTFSGVGCTLSNFKQLNTTWSNGSKATCGNYITFTATPSTTGMFPSGTQTYTLPNTVGANAARSVNFRSVGPVSYSGSGTNYGPSSGSSKFTNNTSLAGFGDGAHSSSIKVALYTNNTSWVNINSITCNSKTPSSTMGYNPNYVTLSAGGTLNISYSAQANSSSSAQIYGLYYYNNTLYQITLKTNTTAAITKPSVTYSESTIASAFGWSYDRSNENIEFNSSRSWFKATNPTLFLLRFAITGNVRFTDTSGVTRSVSAASYTNIAPGATNAQLNVPGTFGSSYVPSRNVSISYTISVYIVNTGVQIAKTDEFH